MKTTENNDVGSSEEFSSDEVESEVEEREEEEDETFVQSALEELNALEDQYDLLDPLSSIVAPHLAPQTIRKSNVRTLRACPEDVDRMHLDDPSSVSYNNVDRM